MRRRNRFWRWRCDKRAMNRAAISRLISNYGMAAVLLLLCVYYSWATLQQHHPAGADQVFDKLVSGGPQPARVLIVAGANQEDRQFVQRMKQRLETAGVGNIRMAGGEPPLARKALEEMIAAGGSPEVIVATGDTA